MATLNKVFLMGYLTRDPELKHTPSGTAVANFGLAVNRKYKQGEEVKEDTCFVDITAWERQAEICKEYLSKGSLVLVEGRLNFSSWVTDEGQKRSKLDVVAGNIQFLNTKSSATTASAENTNPAKSPEAQGNDFDNDEDLPF